MLQREEVEKVLMNLNRKRVDAETLARSALDRLARIASGITKLEEINPAEVEGAADDLASALRRMKDLDDTRSDIRALLI